MTGRDFRLRSAALTAALIALCATLLASWSTASVQDVPRGVSPRAATVIDDRDLQKSTGKKGWTEISSGKAFGKTLSKTRRKGATAKTTQPATNGGSVTFATGPGRGKFVVTAGKEKKKVKTSSKSSKLKTVDFAGTGPVKVKVKKPKRKGVYLDSITLAESTPTTPPPDPVTPGPSAAPASSCAATTTDGGTLTTALGTNLRVCQLPGRVGSNLVLQRIPNLIYSLAGPVEVGTDAGGDPSAPLAGANPVTLTVEAGVVVVADDASDALRINRGSRLDAIGTVGQPIIFTSRSNLTNETTETSAAVWQGITLQGRAPISDCNAAVPGGTAACQQVVDGTTSSLYGGGSPNDNSGSLRFVQIRYAGASPGPSIDGAALRVAGAGQLTTLDHIQVAGGTGGDGLALIGGRVNVTNLALIGSMNDLLDTDLGYRGTMQFLVGVQSAANGGDAMIEADSTGNEEALPRQYARVSNATLIGQSTTATNAAVLLRGGTDYALLNSIVTGSQSCLDIDETGGTTTRGADNPLQDLGPPVFRSVRLACPTAFTADANAAATQTIFGSGTNGNLSNHISTLMGLVNGTNENAVAATDPTAFNADTYAGAGQPNAAAPNRMFATVYIGAIQNGSDTRFVGWTCDLSYASFGSGTSCLTSPI